MRSRGNGPAGDCMIQKRPYVSFKAFFLIWAKLKGWDVPAFHLAMCDWLEHRGRRGTMKVFRGAAKSTILALYQAWRLRDDPQWRFIDRSADDGTAEKLSADTKNVLMLHPLCRGMVKGKLGVERFSVIGNTDQRNASVTAYGIMSNATGSRADEIINDDCEVPKNIKTADTRQTLRDRLSEESYIIVPGGKILYVGTDHTHNSVYDEKIANGYEFLIIPLFLQTKRFESEPGQTFFSLPFAVQNPDELYIIVGIWKTTRVLTPDQYELREGGVKLAAELPEGTVIDFSYGNPWPKYFSRLEIEFRRKECRTMNAWDSQYLLKAKPIHEVRLDPEKLIIYDEQPVISFANSEVSMFLGARKLTGVRACWDCSLGKADSDESIFAVMFQDEAGHLFWQVCDVLTGDVYDQAAHVRTRVIEYNIPSVTILTRGIGGYLPSILREILRQGRDGKQPAVECGIVDLPESENKTNAILGAYEPVLSGRLLHVHRLIAEDGGLAEQMRDWVPVKTNQPDDKLDAGKGCILGLPVKIGKTVVRRDAPAPLPRQEWRQFVQESFEVQVD